MVGLKPTRNKKKNGQKIQFLQKNPTSFYFYNQFFFLQIKKLKKLQHFLKFHDISCTLCINKKMWFWRHCLDIFFFFQLKKKSKWNENLFRVNT